MSTEIAATILAGEIFVLFVYVLRFKATRGYWPRVRNPFF